MVAEADSSPTIGTPKGGKPTVYFASIDTGTASGPVYAINVANCQVDWAFTDFNTTSGPWDPISFGTDVNGRSLILFGSADPDQSVYAVDALTGAKVWSFQTPPLAGNTDTDVGAGVTVSPPGVNGFADGVAYVPAEDGYVFALDLTTGAVLWQYDFGTGLPQIHLSRSTAALSGTRLVFGESGGVMCVNAVTGQPEWTFSTGSVESISDPVLTGPAAKQVVAVSTLAGAFDVLDASTGALLYQYQTPGFSASSFGDVNGTLVVAAADGYLYDFAPGGGNGPAPSTAMTSPGDGQTVANPQGSISITGTASGTSIKAVDVAIQSGGADGQWWDAQSGSWTNGGFFDNVAELTTPLASSTSWTFALPVPAAGGSFHVLVSAVQANGVADISDLSGQTGATNTSFTVTNAPGTPELHVSGSTWVAPGANLNVAGSGFSAGEPVVFTTGGVQVGTATATGTGTVSSTSLVLPNNAPFGPGVIVATGQTSQLTATAAIYVSNEWSQPGYDSGHGNAEPNDVALLDYVAPGPPEFLAPAWSLSLGGAARTSAAVYHDVAFLGDDSGTLTAVDVHNSQPLWATTQPSAIDSSPAVNGKLVFFGTEGHSVVALHEASGSHAWVTRTSSAVESAPALAGNDLYVGSDDGTVYALAQTTGAIMWHTKVAGAVVGSPAVDAGAGVVVVGDRTGMITALSAADGSVLWSTITGGAVTATPSIFGRVVYVGSADSNVYALTESAGKAVWTTTLSGAVTAGGIIYTVNTQAQRPRDYVVGTQDGTVSYLDLATGSVKAVTPVDGAVVGLAASTGWVTATTSTGSISGLKRLGELLWETSVGAPFAAAPVVLNGVVYTTGTNDTLMAYTFPGSPIP
jgi:outer membrane protein assembly factor BamB